MKYLAELSPGNWVDTRQPLRVVRFVRHHLFLIGELSIGESCDEITREHPGPYHVIEVRAWMNGFAETPVREVYYDRDIARARELQIIRLIDEAIASTPAAAQPSPSSAEAITQRASDRVRGRLHAVEKELAAHVVAIRELSNRIASVRADQEVQTITVAVAREQAIDISARMTRVERLLKPKKHQKPRPKKKARRG